jgi:RNA 2',3'-cyclic 3'-phosphodiesterase
VRALDSMADSVRAFIAIPLPFSVIQTAGSIQDGFRAKGLRLKWVRPENIHLTLKFLGEIELEKLADITAVLHEVGKDFSSFSLSARGVGVFPNVQAARVIWMGLTGELYVLEKICEKIEKGLIPLGFIPEKRAFKGHLTLGRMSDRVPAALLQEAITALSEIETGSFRADRIELIQSNLQPNGPVYKQLAEVFFAGR